MSSDKEQKDPGLTGEDTQEEMTDYTNEDTSTLNMDPKIAGALSYFFGFITGIIFLLLEKENKFVRFHAVQSIVLSLTLMVFYFVLSFIPFIGWILSLLLSPVSLILWIFMMYKAFSGDMFKLPVIGDFSEQQIDKKSA